VCVSGLCGWEQRGADTPVCPFDHQRRCLWAHTRVAPIGGLTLYPE